MKCRHERYASLMYSKFVGGGLIASYSTKEQVRICLECAKWLPLGPSNDDSEQVRVEMTAAKFAVRDPRPFAFESLAAAECLSGKEFERCSACQIWALAHAITNHEEPNMFPECVGTTQLAPTNSQCLACRRYGQRCDLAFAIANHGGADE